jgi:hypothetical protein
MSSATQFHTIHDTVAFMSREFPHALVQEWWSRVERVLRHFGTVYGAAPREPIAKLIDLRMVQHPLMTPGLVQELHTMRKLRNKCAHGEVPPLTIEESSGYAYRAWDIQQALAWNNREFLSNPSGPL